MKIEFKYIRVRLGSLLLCMVFSSSLAAQITRDSSSAGHGLGIHSGIESTTRPADIPAQSDAVSFAELLTGNPGIQVTETGAVGATPQLMVRGINTVNLHATPYIFVDGVPIRYTRALPPFLSVYEPTRFGFVNPNDIRHLFVSKEGKELSEIGGRGANGAIYLTTDRGEFGGTKLDFTAHYGISSADYTIERMGPNLFKQYLWDVMGENGISERNRVANPIFDTSLPQYANNTDWLDMISRTARFNDYHVKLKGGDGDANYLFSVGYTGKEETLVGADMERITMRFNLDYKLSSNFEIVNNLSYANITSNYLEQGANWDIHPVYVSSTKAAFFNTNAYNEAGQLSRLLADVDELGKGNPLSLVKNMNNNNEENRIDGLIGARWLASEGLSLNSTLAVNYYNMKERQYRPALGIVNDQHRIRQNAQRSSSEFMLLWNTSLDKEGTWGAQTRYAGKVGFWVETYGEKSVYARKINAGTDDFETLEQGIVDSASNVKFQSNLMTFYLRGEVDFMDRLLVSANVNVDGSSNFGNQGRWNVYPGVRAVADLLDRAGKHQLAVRAVWGRSGNHDIRGYYHYNLYYPANYFGFGGAYLGNVANAAIRPEITNTYDLGLTVNLFDNRLSLDGGYYYKRTTDLITSQAIPIEIGLDPQLENSGTMSARGMEAGFNARILDGQKAVSWSLYGNVSMLKNRVEELYNGDVIKTLGNVSGIARAGESMGSFYGYRILGVFQSESEVTLNKADGTRYQPGDYIIADVNGDSRINELDKQIIGSALPKLFGSFGTALSYKGISLNSLFTFSSGQQIYNSFKQQMHLMSDYSNQSPAVANRWKSADEAGTGLSRAATGDPSANGVASDRWIEDGSYLRLKQVTLSYDVKPWGKIQFLKRAQIYLTGENLLTFTRYSGLDPEVVSFSDPLLRGIDFGASPLPRTFLLGLRTSF